MIVNGTTLPKLMKKCHFLRKKNALYDRQRDYFFKADEESGILKKQICFIIMIVKRTAFPKLTKKVAF